MVVTNPYIYIRKLKFIYIKYILNKLSLTPVSDIFKLETYHIQQQSRMGVKETLGVFHSGIPH